MFKRFVLCLTLLCFTCIVSTANALEIGVPLSLDSENPSAAGIYYMNILEASGAYEYLQDGYKDTWFTVRQGHTNGATRSQARINGIYVFGSGRYHIQANNYVPPHEFIEGSTYYHDFDGYYLAKGYELVQVEPTQSHMSLGNNPTGSDIHWDVAPGYGIERFTVGPAASGGGNNAEIDEETLKKLVETTLKDLGYELGGNGGSGGNGGGSIGGGGTGDGSGGGSGGGGSIHINGGNITISGNVGINGTITISGLETSIKNAVLEAINSGKLKIDWSLFFDTFPDGLPIDWSEFPQYTADPTINITRSVSADQPVSAETGVKLTIEAKDSFLTPKEGAMSVIIDGKKYTGSGATVKQEITVNTNRTVSIVAIDGNGNSRNYDVTISNIDTEAPKIDSLQASRETWTKDPVDVIVKATDDQKLADKPYRWYYQSTTAQGDGKPTKPSSPVGDWTAENSFKAEDSGNVWVEVRDATGQVTLSPPCYVRCIDKIAPKVAGHQLDPKEGLLSSPQIGTTVTVDIDNVGDPASKDASPLASLMVQWNDGEPWRNSMSTVVKENTVLHVRVRDSLGNVSDPAYEIVVGNVADSKPHFVGAESTAAGAEWVRPPVILSVYAEKGNDGTAADLAERPFSWTDGNSWLLPNDTQGETQRSDFTVWKNGQYTVMVRDTLGTITEQTFIVSNIDERPPEVEIFTYKDLPDDWDTSRDGDGTPDDYVWRLKVNAVDRESGIDHVELHFGGENASIDATQLPYNMELQEPGIYAVTAYDRANNSMYAEKSITYESLGEAGGAGSHTYVDIKTPPEGTGGAAFMGASIGDLVYSTNGVYNMKTAVFSNYSATNSGYEGIEVHVNVTASSSHWITGYATFGSGRYPVEVAGSTNGTRGFRDMPCVVKIPKSALVQDVKNGKLIIVMQEYSTDPGGNDNPNHAKLLKEGTATLYTNVQVNPPKLNFTYNRTTDELTIVATSAVAGIAPNSPTYSLGGGETVYTGPFKVNGANTVVLKAVDNCGLSTELTLDGNSLPVTGEGGGSLPTQDAGSGTNSYYMSGRSAEIYIIGGTKQNTNNIPSSTVINQITGSGAGPTP